MKLQSKLVKMILWSFLLAFAVVGCGSAGSGDNVEPDIESSPSLDGTSWVLQAFGPDGSQTPVLPDTTVTLLFEDGRVSGSANCNTYFADVTQDGSALSFGPIGSTRMACPEPIMQQENDFLAAMASVNHYVVAEGQLTLTYDGGLLIFATAPAGETEDEVDADADGTIKTLFVGPELVDCVGVAPQQCLQVKENEADDWTLFYDQIEGFTHEPGFIYELRVQETTVENPPADASSLALSLVEVVSQTAVATTPEAQPEGSNELDGTHWNLISYGPMDNVTAVLPDSAPTLNFAAGQANGNASCNSYSGEVTLGEDGTMTVGMLASTLMACADQAMMQQEADFMAALAQVTSYTLSGSQLTLQTPDGVLNFEAAE